MKKFLYLLVFVFLLTGCASDAKDESTDDLQIEKETISSLEKITEEESKIEHNIAERINYNLEEITQKRYEKAGSYIEFKELPENVAETIVCYDLLYRVLGTHYKMHQFEYNVFEIDEETSDVEKQSVYDWIEVTELETMEFDELKEQEEYDYLFEQLKKKLAPEMELDDYVKMILDNGCAVVLVRYEDKYTEEYNASLPQSSDGKHKDFWLFVPDENNQLRIFDNTHYYSHFNFYKTDAPDSLILNIKKN